MQRFDGKKKKELHMERDNRNFYAFASTYFGFITYCTYFKLPKHIVM